MLLDRRMQVLRLPHDVYHPFEYRRNARAQQLGEWASMVQTQPHAEAGRYLQGQGQG